MIITTVFPTKPERSTSVEQSPSSSHANKVSIWLLIFLGVLATLLLAATIVLAVLYGLERNKTRNLQTMQTTPTTVMTKTTTTATSTTRMTTTTTANALLESIDETVDPCENFYQFSCGTFLKVKNIPLNDAVQNRFSELDERIQNAVSELLSSSTSDQYVQFQSITNARRLYASCIDEDAIMANSANELLEFVNTELGGWPILQGSRWDNSTFDINRLLLTLSEYNNPVFYVIESTLSSNKTYDLIQISQGGLGLGDFSSYIQESAGTLAYREFIRKLALALTNDTSRIDDDVNDIFQFEKAIAENFYTADNSNNDDLLSVTIGNLTAAINSSFDFTDYIRRLYRTANMTVNDTDLGAIAASLLNFFQDFPSFLNQYSSRTIQNYVVWRFMMNRALNLPEDIRAIRRQFYRVIQGVGDQPSRAITCSKYVLDSMSLPVAKIFVDKYFDENARNDTMELVENLRESLIGIINQTTWMDSVSKSKAIEKAQAIYVNLGYPDYLDDDNLTKLEKDYAEYKFNSSFMINVLAVLRLTKKENLLLLHQSVNQSTWSVSPLLINAQYEAVYNSITLPAAILQPYFFDQDAPKYLNYGSGGMVIGHELTHGFDNDGRQYDKDGNMVAWWTQETIDAFNERTQCIIDQYSNYTDTQVDVQVNGTVTQGENIADNGGLKESFFAYQKWAQTYPHVDKKLPGLNKYSAEQMFFINFGYTWCQKATDSYLSQSIPADAHSPNQFRVLGTTSNFVEFDRAFNCTPGQGNSRVNKCIVW